MRKVDQLHALLGPVVESMGFVFWGLEYIQGRGAVLRVFIDHEDGISVDNCADVSHQISGVLDVEDPISGEYNLEVSSPGMDRPLFTLEQYGLYIGEQVQLRLLAPVASRRRMTATLDAVDGDDLHLTLEGQALVVPFTQVDRANVVPQFD
ncbi:ribosome maturation factor RimP [Isoalcanivorax beigongshangi]|uniref:Ribosome maturation factor RimP n=1 Tax=Isoalcanivorax beigongshangi TaxID=3238810 RepID=A0ABV4ADG3_9GAMM